MDNKTNRSKGSGLRTVRFRPHVHFTFSPQNPFAYRRFHFFTLNLRHPVLCSVPDKTKTYFDGQVGNRAVNANLAIAALRSLTLSSVSVLTSQLALALAHRANRVRQRPQRRFLALKRAPKSPPRPHARFYSAFTIRRTLADLVFFRGRKLLPLCRLLPHLLLWILL